MIGVTKLLTQRESKSDKLRYGTGHSFKKDGKYCPVIVFNITSVCNLFCKHCYYSAKTKKDPEELSTQEVKKIIDDLSELGSPVILFSGGEPLMREDIFDLISYASDKGIEPALSTNGTLIDEKIVEKIKSSGASYVGISIDGNEKIHDEFRGKKGSFNLSVDGIKNCIRNGVRVSVRLTLTKRNLGELMDILEWADSIGVSRFCIYHLITTGRGKNICGDSLQTDETRRIMGNVIEKAKKLRMEILTVDNPCDGIYLIAYQIRNGEIENAKYIYERLKIQGGDGTGKRIAVIDHRGNVHLSQFWLDFSLGNVREKNFSEIWNTSSNILDFLRSGRRKLTGRCGECKFVDVCGGFRPRAYLTTGEISGSDPACYITKEDEMIISSHIYT